MRSLFFRPVYLVFCVLPVFPQFVGIFSMILFKIWCMLLTWILLRAYHS